MSGYIRQDLPIMRAVADVTPSSDTRGVHVMVPRPLPGLVILVHGVNSTGEWYEAAEAGLCEGLNKRLGRDDLVPARYDADQYELLKANKSPVIRFLYGWRPAGNDTSWQGKVPMDAHGHQPSKGGGPFQNGGNNLPELWERSGFKHTAFGVYDLNNLNPRVDIRLHDAPDRRYFVHAAQRLADLIKTIREWSPKEPITVVCHSQGNMVTMASAFLLDEMGVLPANTYILNNAPYALDWATTEIITAGGQRNARGEIGAVASPARLQTFANFLAVAEKAKAARQTPDFVEQGVAKPGWWADAAHEKSMDGCVVLNFCPHDRLIGSTAVQGIGWRGVSGDEYSRMGRPANFSQRLWMSGMPVGVAMQHGAPTMWSAPHPLPWNPKPDIVRFMGIPIQVQAELPKGWSVPLKAKPVPEPLMEPAPRSGPDLTQKGDPSRSRFDEDGDRLTEDDIRQRLEVEPRPTKWAESAGGPRVPVQRKEMPVSDAEYRDHVQRLEARLRAYLRASAGGTKDIPATDHGTIVGSQVNVARVLAYDVAIGVSCLTDEDLHELRKVADWRFGRDPYYETGECTVPPMPAGIIDERVSRPQPKDSA